MKQNPISAELTLSTQQLASEQFALQWGRILPNDLVQLWKYRIATWTPFNERVKPQTIKAQKQRLANIPEGITQRDYKFGLEKWTPGHPLEVFPRFINQTAQNLAELTTHPSLTESPHALLQSIAQGDNSATELLNQANHYTQEQLNSPEGQQTLLMLTGLQAHHKYVSKLLHAEKLLSATQRQLEALSTKLEKQPNNPELLQRKQLLETRLNLRQQRLTDLNDPEKSLKFIQRSQRARLAYLNRLAEKDPIAFQQQLAKIKARSRHRQQYWAERTNEVVTRWDHGFFQVSLNFLGWVQPFLEEEPSKEETEFKGVSSSFGYIDSEGQLIVICDADSPDSGAAGPQLKNTFQRGITNIEQGLDDGVWKELIRAVQENISSGKPTNELVYADEFGIIYDASTHRPIAVAVGDTNNTNRFIWSHVQQLFFLMDTPKQIVDLIAQANKHKKDKIIVALPNGQEVSKYQPLTIQQIQALQAGSIPFPEDPSKTLPAVNSFTTRILGAIRHLQDAHQTWKHANQILEQHSTSIAQLKQQEHPQLPENIQSRLTQEQINVILTAMLGITATQPQPTPLEFSNLE